MSDNQTKRPASELLNSQMNVDEKHTPKEESSNEELLERHKVYGSPFHIVGNKELGYFLVLGKYRMTESFTTVDDVLQHMEDEKWNIILKLVVNSHVLVIESMNDGKLELTEKEKQNETTPAPDFANPD